MKVDIKRLCQWLVVLMTFSIAQAVNAQGLIRDAEIENYLNQITAPVLEQAGLSKGSVDILLIDDPRINAFVTNGETIFINYGLVLHLKTAAQLQAVLAHEIAHIISGHFSQRIVSLANTRTNANLSIILGLAAAVAGNPAAGVGVAIGTLSSAQRHFFANTRDQEASADRTSLRLLADAGIDPHAAVEVLEILDGQDIFTAQEIDPYMVTHPLTDARRAAISALAPKLSVASAPLGRADALYTRMRAKIIGFTRNPKAALVAYPISDKAATARYARAIAYHRLPDRDAALREINTLTQDYPDDPYYQELKGQILLELGRAELAVQAYRDALERLPEESQIQAALGAALIGAHRYDEALEVLENAYKEDKMNARLLRSLGLVYGKKKQHGLAAVMNAEYYALLGDFDTARIHATRAQRLLKRGSTGWLQADDILLAIPKPKG